MPPLDHYVEAFGGSAAVLLNRPAPSGREIYSDLNAPMVSRMSEVRDDAERLVWRLRFTPYSRRGYMEAKARLKDGGDAADAHTLKEQGFNGKPSWNAKVNPMSDDRGKVSSNRQGVAADADTVVEQAMMSSQQAGWRANKASGKMAADAIATRHGVGAEGQDGEDALTTCEQSMQGLTAARGSRSKKIDGDAVGSITAVSAGRRHGVGADEFAVRDQSVNGEGGWKVSVNSDAVRTARPQTSSTRQGVAADIQETLEQGCAGKEAEGWVANIDGEAARPAKPQRAAKRQGVAADAQEVTASSVYGAGGWGATINADAQPGGKMTYEANRVGVSALDGGMKVKAQANRLGVNADAEDVAVATGASMWGTQNGFGKAVDGEKRESVAITNASRQGVDVQQMHAHGVFGKAGYFGTAIDPNTNPQSVSESNRQGVPHSGKGVIAPPGWDTQPAGYVIPIDGQEGIEILLSYPPTKCETICDESGTIYDLFRAAREYPRTLINAGVEGVRSVADAIARFRRRFWAANTDSSTTAR